jgi:regulator of cell morphogenesis and NO signaling
MNNIITKPVKELLFLYPDLFDFFEKYNVDFYCNGEQTISEILSNTNAKNEEKKIFLNRLQVIISNQAKNKNIENHLNATLKDLCTYITEKHHSFVLSEIKVIEELYNGLKCMDNDNDERILQAEKLTNQLFLELKTHLSKEETVLFPLVKYLEGCKQFAEKPHLGRNRPMEKSILVLEADHNLSVGVVSKIKKILRSIKNNELDRKALKALVGKIDGFEKDLHIHIHLENNLLFPKAIELEDYLYTTYKR